MDKTSKYVYDFLDDHLGLYNNQQGIEFVVNNDDTVFVNYWIKDPSLEAHIEFGLFYSSESFNDFINDFRFAGTRALKALSPDRLWEMYNKGQAEVYCIVAEKENFYMLYFRRTGNTMIVRDEHDNEYELEEILQTPRQFVEYTQQRSRTI